MRIVWVRERDAETMHFMLGRLLPTPEMFFRDDKFADNTEERWLICEAE